MAPYLGTKCDSKSQSDPYEYKGKQTFGIIKGDLERKQNKQKNKPTGLVVFSFESQTCIFAELEIIYKIDTALQTSMNNQIIFEKVKVGEFVSIF